MDVFTLLNEKGGVDLAYQQGGTTEEMDLSLSGRGFQQMLLIFAHLPSKRGVRFSRKARRLL